MYDSLLRRHVWRFKLPATGRYGFAIAILTRSPDGPPLKWSFWRGKYGGRWIVTTPLAWAEIDRVWKRPARLAAH